MRTLYTLVITFVFCFSLFAVYNVGYERGKNQEVWKGFYETGKEPRVSLNNTLGMYKMGYVQGILAFRLSGSYQSAMKQFFKNDSIAARNLIK